MGIRRDLVERGMGIETKGEEILAGTVRMGKERWRIVGVYVGRNGIEETLKKLDRNIFYVGQV